MNKIKLIIVLCLIVISNVFAQKCPTIVVVDPKPKSGITSDEISAISNYFESKIANKYEIHSRNILKSIFQSQSFEDIVLSSNSEISKQLAAQSIDFLFVYNIGKIADKYNMSMRVVDSRTGRIVADERGNISADNLSELYTKIDVGLDKIGLLNKTNSSNKSMAILPIKSLVEFPLQLSKSFESKLSSALVNTTHFNILSRSDFDAIVAENELAISSLADQDQLYKISQLDIADYLIVVEVIRLELQIKASNTTIAGSSKGKEFYYIQFNIKLLDGKSGRLIAQEDISDILSATDVPIELRSKFAPFDYYNYFFDIVIKRAVNEIIIEINEDKKNNPAKK